MTALQSLTNTNKSLSQTQNKIATGYRVNSAKTMPPTGRSPPTMRSDRGRPLHGQGRAGPRRCHHRCRLYGMNSAIDVTKEIKNKLVAARQPGIDREKGAVGNSPNSRTS